MRLKFILTLTLFGELGRFMYEAAQDDEIKVMQDMLTDNLDIVQCLREIGRDLCCALNEDASMNEKAFHHLCKLALNVGCTHLPWWDADYCGIEEEKEELVLSIDYKAMELIIEEAGYSALVMGQPKTLGCFCPANTLLRSALKPLTKAFDIILLDCEAGLEQINRKSRNKM